MPECEGSGTRHLELSEQQEDEKGRLVTAEWEPLLNISPSGKGIMEMPAGIRSFF